MASVQTTELWVICLALRKPRQSCNKRMFHLSLRLITYRVHKSDRETITFTITSHFLLVLILLGTNSSYPWMIGGGAYKQHKQISLPAVFQNNIILHIKPNKGILSPAWYRAELVRNSRRETGH